MKDKFFRELIMPAFKALRVNSNAKAWIVSSELVSL